jgi:hypothetical protein
MVRLQCLGHALVEGAALLARPLRSRPLLQRLAQLIDRLPRLLHDLRLGLAAGVTELLMRLAKPLLRLLQCTLLSGRLLRLLLPGTGLRHLLCLHGGSGDDCKGGGRGRGQEACPDRAGLAAVQVVHHARVVLLLASSPG